jgi:hypothetical protein
MGAGLMSDTQVIAASLHALLENLIDYAGLFPPASLPMDRAIASYDAYRRGEHAWALGRFVVPFDRVAEVPVDFPLSVLVAIKDLPRLDHSIDVIETNAANANDVAAIAGAAGGRTVYVEVADSDMVKTIGRRGMRAKFRTGGLTQAAIPGAERVARFIRECAAERVPFKATAGLHHPVRCAKPLTYEPNAPVGTMHGFINVFMAAALVGAVDEEVLLETDPRAFTFGNEAASWRGHSATTALLERVRKEFAISFGSCSFEEPIAELKELGWL